MIPLFAFPLGFVALAALPALAAIYWMRNRFQSRTVSSLFLWGEITQPREGGSRLQRFRAPLAFILELATILFVVLAAAGPALPTKAGERPLSVVLDDSFSMTAGIPDSPREKARRWLNRELERGQYAPIHLILAGQTPQLLGAPAASAAAAMRLAEGWSCAAAAADLEAATALALAIEERGAVIVITDRAPIAAPENPRLEWQAFGVPRGNAAFVAASRAPRENGDRCLFEVSNFALAPRRVTLRLEEARGGRPSPARQIEQHILELAAGESKRLLVELPGETGTITARLGNDELGLDNEVTLLPSGRRGVRVKLAIEDSKLRQPLERALAASGRVELVESRPQLVVTDHPGEPQSGVWTLEVLAERESSSFIGPYAISHAHPLAAGLALDGVVWGGGKSPLPGAIVILGGSVPLLTDSRRPGGEHHVRLRWRPDLSTLQQSPSWPALIWNLLEWRAASAPGFREASVRLGADAVLTLESDATSVSLSSPDGVEHEMPSTGESLWIRASQAGVWEARTANAAYRVAVNALAAEESDLRVAAAGRWGASTAETSAARGYESVAWIFLLLALSTLAAHQRLVGRETRA